MKSLEISLAVIGVILTFIDGFNLDGRVERGLERFNRFMKVVLTFCLDHSGKVIGVVLIGFVILVYIGGPVSNIFGEAPIGIATLLAGAGFMLIPIMMIIIVMMIFSRVIFEILGRLPRGILGGFGFLVALGSLALTLL